MVRLQHSPEKSAANNLGISPAASCPFLCRRFAARKDGLLPFVSFEWVCEPSWAREWSGSWGNQVLIVSQGGETSGGSC